MLSYNMITSNKTTLNNMNPRTSQHEQKTWTHVIRLMLWCPGVHVVQCCLITCVHVFYSCCDVLGFMLFNVGLLHVITFFVHVKNVNTCNKTTLNNMNPRTSQHEQKTWSHVIRQHSGVHVVQCCLITCVHVFCSCCDVQGFMLFNVVLLHVFTFFVHVQHWTTWTPGHHNMNKKHDHM
jgi:hypothetical protein